MNIQSFRGFHDILPDEIRRWHSVEAATRELFELYGYSEIRTPVLERVELFSRGVGEDTDIVQKEMYVIENEREGSMALRPEGTAAVVRAYNEHKLSARHPLPEKLYYILPMFRHERPQAGRFRQFHQIGAEALGVDSPAIDAEMIAMIFQLFLNMGVTDIEVQLNSVGCKSCRPDYRRQLKTYLTDSYDRLCEDCQQRIERNPMRVLDCKQERCREIVSGAPVIIEQYCEECQRHFTELQDYLRLLEIDFHISPRMVRGLDYYVRTAFEFVSSSLGAQSAVLGGGRYDGLSENIGGKALPGVGFAMGMERFIALLPDQAQAATLDVFIAVLGASARKPAVTLQKELRRAGIRTEIEYHHRSLKSQMKKADKLGAAYVILLGDNEIETGVAVVRNMCESSQQEIQITRLAARLTELLKG
ncbi:histidine--tRNA ligase [candidate division KSB3 bacterium]|uniref:Histidine--tRNA ligase n=1 Tax=candidate division KSB3 bacterium TaxID=2044937 RepID=A0A2G6E6F8_9BACT|nr:MAG: histidine--tRNA ligase [candidate division KSB3 bacterium]PIE30050.1 MAG: histidine--tRNA ligase [candidate division KSB3 bacterium]